MSRIEHEYKKIARKYILYGFILSIIMVAGMFYTIFAHPEIYPYMGFDPFHTLIRILVIVTFSFLVTFLPLRILLWRFRVALKKFHRSAKYYELAAKDKRDQEYVETITHKK